MAMAKKIKIAVSVTFEVDADGWEMDYGDRGSIRDDVKDYLRDTLNHINDNLTVSKLT
jgi:hypothetical protein